MDRRHRSQRGQATVELAGAIAFLCLLVLGLMDVTPAIVRTAQLHHAVREGVTYGRVTPGSTSDIQARVVAAVTSFTPTAITVTCYEDLTTTTKACSSASIGDSIRVQATYTYVPITGLFQAIVGPSLTITRSADSEIY